MHPATPPTPVPSPALSLEFERLAAISVRRRLPDLAKRHDDLTPSAHAVALDLVAEAIERAQPDMFVLYLSGGAETFPILEYEMTDAGHFPSYPDGEMSTGVLKKYGGTTLLGYVSGQTSYILSYNVEPKPLPERAPGLVWEVELYKGQIGVSFVSVDGESYAFDSAALDLQAGTPSTWPAPVSSPAFGRMAFAVGRRPQTRDIEAADKAVLDCAEQARKRMTSEQIAAEPALEARWIRRNCRSAIIAWEKTFGAIIEDNVKARMALVEKAKARLLPSAPKAKPE